jgi:hypothetical protein
VEDRIDESLRYFWDYHFDGTERTYYKHIITSQDKTNQYITMPENIIGAVRIFDIGDPMVSNNLFDIRYQIALNDLYTLTSVSMIPYYMAFQHIQLLEQLLVGKQFIRYNRHRNRLHLDMNWDKVTVGNYLIVEAFEIVDPELFPDVWADRWLQEYTSQKIKQQWGANLIKFIGMELPGGVKFNGQKLYDDATNKIEKMEEEMILNYSLPVTDMIG